MSGRRRWISALGLVACWFLPRALEACAVCYGDVDSPLTAGVNNGILVLLAVVAGVQIFFVAVFLGIRRRARQVGREKREFQVIRGGAG